MTDKSVAIIGGGPAGLVAAKEMRAAGLRPTIFETASTLGGLWRPGGGAWEGMRANLSHHSCVFSDHAWPQGTPDFPRATAVYGYLQDYAARFGLNDDAKFDTRVDALDRDGLGWLVTTTDSAKRLQRRHFDHAIVASGIFQKPYLPPVGGQARAKLAGSMLHGSAYRAAADFMGQRVAVIGSGFSGNEIASELAAAGVAVTQVVRSPVWVASRLVPRAEGDAVPIDLAFYSRAKAEATARLTPAEAARRRNRYMAATFGNPGSAAPPLDLRPDSLLPYGVVVADNYLDHVRAGRITVQRGEVESFGQGSMRLASGADFAADRAIFCTGYNVALPFLRDDLRRKLTYDDADRHAPVLLHKETFHPAMPNLAFIGLYRGPYFGVMELQARWAAGIFSGSLAPLTAEDMQDGIAEAHGIRDRHPRPQFPRGDYVGFADGIARAAGVLPDPAREDTALAQQLREGPLLPAHYRLQGPGAARGVALAAIESAAARLRQGCHAA